MTGRPRDTASTTGSSGDNGPMQRMTGLDASFLYLETEEQMLLIQGLVHLDVSTVDGGYSFDRFAGEFARRVKSIPPFRRKIYDSPLNLGHPAWVEDFTFDIARHVHRVVLHEDATETDLLEACGHFASVPLDREHPLWEVRLVEWGEGKVTAFCRVHHALIDGMLGAEFLSMLASTDSSHPAHELDLVRTHVGGPNRTRLLLGGAWEAITRPVAFLRLLPETIGIPREMARARRAIGSAESMPAPFTAPRTVFNHPITPTRALATATIEFARVAEVRKLLGGTINDVILAVVAGAVRDYLEAHGDLPDTPTVAVVPMSTRADLTAPGANQVTAMFTTLATDVADPVERHAVIAATSDIAKQQAGAIRPALLANWGRMSPRWLISAGMRAYGALGLADRHPVVYNLIVSNVPGSRDPMYFLGARITHMYPFGPILHGAGLNITSLSFDGHLDVGVLACEHLVPDPELVALGIEESLDALLAAAEYAAAAAD